MKKRISQLLDLVYGASKYPWGLLNPTIVKGDFKDNEKGPYQKLFFKELIKYGFKRTRWQLIFPNQTAGLIKKIKRFDGGANEYHIRFYKEGTITCELEVDRFNGLHWTGPRNNGDSFLEKNLNQMNELSNEQKKIIKSLFNEKDYSNICTRRKQK